MLAAQSQLLLALLSLLMNPPKRCRYQYAKSGEEEEVVVEYSSIVYWLVVWAVSGREEFWRCRVGRDARHERCGVV
jgi:hypothetical protein